MSVHGHWVFLNKLHALLKRKVAMVSVSDYIEAEREKPWLVSFRLSKGLSGGKQSRLVFSSVTVRVGTTEGGGLRGAGGRAKGGPGRLSAA